VIDKLKEKIEMNRNDKNIYREYIKAFVNSDKAKELFSNDRDFAELIIDAPPTSNKKEDEYF